MPRPASRQPALSDLVNLAAQLRRDEGRDRAWLWRRDRDIGREVSSLNRRPALQIVAWLDRAAEPADRVVGERVARAQRLVVLVLVLLGAAVGWAAAAAVFYYTGDRPVNVVGVLAVFVGLQLILLGLFILAALPDRLLRWAPGAEAVIDALRLLSPGRLAPLIARWLPQEHRDALAAAIGSGEAHQQRFGIVQKWAVLTWSQAFAVAFNVGALLRYLYLVFFSDLAFVWSTTLQTDASVFHGITRVLAYPWAWALPAAAPTHDLVSATRYFRLDEGTLASWAAEPVDPGYFGGWWPFLLMCLLVYGLGPRVATLALSAWRLRRAVDRAVLHTPGAAAVLDRLSSEFVQTQSAEPIGAAAHDAAPVDAPAEPPSAALQQPAAAVVNWSGVPMADDALRALVGRPDAPVYHAGGAYSLEEDRQVIRQVAESASGSRAAGAAGAAVVVKGWEPPVLELLDFLADLRTSLGPAAMIRVLPVGGDGPAGPAHLAQWRRKLAAAGDPWLSVATAEGGES